MMAKNRLYLTSKGYRPLIKLYDFISINGLLCFILYLNNETANAIDTSSALLFSGIFMLYCEYANLYKIRSKIHLLRYLSKVTPVFILTCITTYLLSSHITDLDGISASIRNDKFYFIWFTSIYIMLISTRILWFFVYQRIIFPRKKKPKVAILGLTRSGLAMEHAIKKEYEQYANEVLFYDDRNVKRFGYLTKSQFAGDFEQLLADIKRDKISRVYIALPMVAKKRINAYLLELSNTTIATYMVPDLYAYHLNVSQVSCIGGVHTFSIFGSPLEGLGTPIKRIEDLVIGSLITVMILPVLVLVAIGVKMTSPGPILFKQDRYGLGGKCIKVWKFRSMSVMENEGTVIQATKNDPRVTSFGRFLRRTSLDELPQFFNVLTGQMSIVGPRPHAVAHNEQYRKIVNNYMIRHKIKPGITGLAQINGYRGETDTLGKMEKRIQYDIKYLQHWSLAMDIKIIFLTVFKGFVSETAY